MGIDTVVVGQHLHPDGYVIRMPYQFRYHVRVVAAVYFLPNFILVFSEKLLHGFFIKVMEADTFILQL